MDLRDIPKDPIRARAVLITENAIALANKTVDYIHEEYNQASLLLDCVTFIDSDMNDCLHSNFEKFKRVGFFPVTEANYELGESLSRILQCSYKSVHDNLRRALELVLVGTYFTLPEVSEDKAKAWLNSKDNTPFFKSVLDALCKAENFKSLTEKPDWKNKITSFYHELCDTVHTRGRQHSSSKLQSASVTNNIAIPNFNEQSLISCLDLFIDAVRHISVIFATSNPVLLVGLPMIQKFGPDGPISGFFEEEQSERLWRLIPDQFHQVLKTIKEQDENVKAKIEWIENLPDWEGIV